MRVKKLEAFGFKSFKEKTTFSFEAGITTIVGPNGCGKSNIVDAIRWVMGEQNARNLRGEVMEDVIFNGSKSESPLGMAEVSLYFSNENGDFPAGYSEYNEIMVNRRLFRSGESEFYINKVPCRLKEIRELFMDTGVGRRSYAIIEQGEIENFINSKPEDRRYLIEEAAGISKYKSRKDAALRKIESTKQNILRIKDIIQEVVCQKDNLDYQAKKAERYKKLKKEIKEIEIGLAAKDYYALDNKRSELLLSLRDCDGKKEKLSYQIGIEEAGAEEGRLKLLEKEKKLGASQEELSRSRGNLQKVENKVQSYHDQLERLKKLIQKDKKEIKELKVRLEETREKTKNIGGERENLEKNVSLEKEKLSKKELVLKEVTEIFGLLSNKLEKERDNLVDMAKEEACYHDALLNLTQHKQTLKQQLAKNSEEKKGTARRVEESREEGLKLERELEASQNQKDVFKKNLATEKEELKRLKGSLSKSEATLKILREKLSQKSSRLRSLQELEKGFEWYQKGVRSLMLTRGSGAGKEDGILGLVADIVETAPEYESAVEAVLGERLQYIIVKDQKSGVGAIEYLKANSSGRSSFIPFDLRQQKSAYSLDPPDKGLQMIPLLNLVNIKSDFARIGSFLLDNVFLVKDLEHALRFWNKSTGTMVTLDGEVVTPQGIIAGGSKESVGSGILRKRRELKELKEAVFELSEEFGRSENKHRKIVEEIAAARTNIEEIVKRIHQEEISIVNYQKDFSRVSDDSNQFQRRLEVLLSDRKNLLFQMKDCHREMGDVSIKNEEFIARKKGREDLLRRLQKEAATLREKVERTREESTEGKILVASLKEKLESINNNLIQLKEFEEDLLRQILKKEKGLKETEQEIEYLQSLDAESRIEINRLIEVHREFETSLFREKEEYQKEVEKLREKEEFLKKLRKELGETNQKINHLNLELDKLILHMKHVEDRIEEKYQVRLEKILFGVKVSDFGTKESEKRISWLNKMIKSLGEINLMAIKEHEELTKRYDFLTEQQTDLVQSLDSLQKAITKINRITKKRFKEVFGAINSKFQEVFSLLFEGGQAELFLTDESDLLETGIDVTIRPPGKRLQNINLLSKGEKVLAAIALMFSLFLIKPTPFSLLDEVDAALDDANNDRFIKMVKRLSADSQFIIISHNKKAMEISDTLLGVTMENAGVSKLISVKMN